MRPIISPNIRVRYPALFVVGEDSVIDDYCYFSTQVTVGRGSHIASNCTIAGGRTHRFALGDLASVSAGVRIWCASNDFARDLVALTPPGYDDPAIHLIVGDVLIGDLTGIGANSVIMPDSLIPEGAVVGALSFVPPRARLEPWSVYAGAPVRRIGDRDRDRVLAQAARLRDALSRSDHR